MREDVGDVFLVSLGGGIPFRNDGVELRLGISAARTKPVVPDIERLQRTPEARLNQRPRFREQRRR